MHKRGGFSFYLIGKFYQKIKILSNFVAVSGWMNWVKIGDENLGEGKFGLVAVGEGDFLKNQFSGQFTRPAEGGFDASN